MGATHEVFNQPLPLADINLFDTNRPLQDAVRFNAQGADLARLKAVGALAGSATMQNEARLANAHLPQLRTHDRYGHRIDEVEFHPGYHALMRGATEAGLHGTPYAAAEQASGHAHVQRPGIGPRQYAGQNSGGLHSRQSRRGVRRGEQSAHLVAYPLARKRS